MSTSLVHRTATMGTVLTIEVVLPAPGDNTEAQQAIERAVQWFSEVTARCNRFDPSSELSQLTANAGSPMVVSALLYQALQFSVAVATDSGGAFDPTLGRAMEIRGFDREFRTGAQVRTADARDASVTFRDIALDPDTHSVTLLRPLLLDLGGVAKGLAVDLAARELHQFQNFAIDAGGDVYAKGRNSRDEPWSIGIRHPRDPAALIARVTLDNTALCTSGDYERHTESGHHLLDPRTRAAARELASVSVLAPTAIVADALATTAFVLGATAGAAFLEAQGVAGLLITPDLERFATAGFPNV